MSEKDADIRKYLRVILGRRWFLIAFFVLMVGGVGLFTVTQTPLYRATTLVLLQMKQIQFMGGIEGIQDPTQDMLTTQHQLLESRRIAEPVWRQTGKDKTTTISSFVAAISVEPQIGGRLVRVGYTSPSPTEAADIANAIVESFMRDNTQRAMGITDAGLTSLRNKAAALRAQVEEAALAVQVFKRAHENLPRDGMENAASTRVSSLDQSLAVAETDRINAQAFAEAFAAAGPQGADSERLNELRLEVTRLGEERDVLLQRVKIDHPSVVVTTTRLEAAQVRVALAFEFELAAARSRLAAIKEREERLRAELERVLQAVEQSAADVGDYRALVQTHDHLVKTHDDVLARINEIELAESTSTRDMSVFWVERAEVPATPIYPHRTKNLGIACLLGLVGGIALCFLVDYLDRSIKTKEDVERLLGLPVLGFVPAVGDESGQDAGPPELLGARPRSPLAEAFRQIRTGVSFGAWSADPRATRKVMVTSTLPRDGKTLVSINLAIAFAHQGKRTLLIDCDLRKPRVDGVFDLGRERGLSNLLAGEEELDALERIAHPIEAVPNLSVLTSGPLPPNPADLLNSDRMQELLRHCDGRFAWVVLDAPPSALADPVILSTQVGNVVFVVRSFVTPRELAQQACQQLANVESRVIGVVMNNASLPRTAHDGVAGYGSGIGYGYAEVPEGKQATSTGPAA